MFLKRAGKVVLGGIFAAILSAALYPMPGAQACMAVGTPDVRIVRDQENDEHAVAFFSMYDCAAMPQKTFCCIGVRFESNDAWRKAKIRVKRLRFVGAISGKVRSGFNPTFKMITTKSFANELDGEWTAFYGVYRKQQTAAELSEIKIEFSVAPGTTDKELMAAFANCYIGASEGQANGEIIKGKSEHKEIIKVGQIKVYGRMHK